MTGCFFSAVFQVGDLSGQQNFTCGVMAGFFASILTQPADVVKTRLQLNPYMYASNTDAILCIIKVLSSYSCNRSFA
jgi:solute carrier family 25 protein 38